MVVSKTIQNDTIAAIATATGRGGIGIVRVSGEKSLSIAEKILGSVPLPRKAVFCHVKKMDGQYIDEGVAIFFPAPNSFTGEDVLELQVHGNPVVLDEVLKSVLVCGARMAQPGEFSERAFLNNKIDLAQAEAIADLIAAESLSAVQSAQATLQGVFSKEVNTLIERLVALRVYVEAALDFPEEEIEFLGKGKVAEQINQLKEQLEKTLGAAKQGSLITEGMTLVIAGKPNAGKSSILNALAGRDIAIVTPIAGTTRDILREHIQLDGIPLHIVDTAGLRDSNDLIEKEGIRRAINEIKNADRILLIVDSNDPDHIKTSLVDIWPPAFSILQNHIPVTKIFNKCDVSGLPAKRDQRSVTLSAKTGEGIDLLKEHLKEVMGYSNTGGGRFSARRRHLQALQEAADHIELAGGVLSRGTGAELLAEELRLAQKSLELITGRFTPDDLLEKIFRDFCIGK